MTKLASSWRLAAGLALACALPGCLCKGRTGPASESGTGGGDGGDAGRGVDSGVGPDAGPGPDAAAPGTDAVAPGTDAVPPGTDAGPFVPTCPPPGPLDCSPGSGTGKADQCFDATSCFITDVQGSVTSVLADHPEWFDYANPTMCPFILNIDGYMDTVVLELLGRGVCAIRDPNAPGEEVTVKHDNTFSENFDIVASTGCARWGPLIYTGYCTPAWW